MSQLDLQLTLVGAGAIGEDVQNQLSARQHARAKLLLEVALLRGTELMIGDHQVRVEAVEVLIASGVRAVGGDIVSADNPVAIAAGAPAHTKALAAGMPIFEGLINLEGIVNKRFFFMALPLAIVAGDASPVRAVALLDAEI